MNGSIAKSLRRFADYGELKKAALMVTAFQLDRAEIKQLKVRVCVQAYCCRWWSWCALSCVVLVVWFACLVATWRLLLAKC